MHIPDKAKQMTTPVLLQMPTSGYINGVLVKSYTNAPYTSACNFSSYGGTETTVNGILSVDDTATVTMWFDPEVKSNCRIKRLTDNALFEIVGEPENIELRNIYMVFKVRRVKGGV